MDLYKDSGTIHTFPAIEEMRSVLEQRSRDLRLAEMLRLGWPTTPNH
jgi:hypothetical protein